MLWLLAGAARFQVAGGSLPLGRPPVSLGGEASRVMLILETQRIPLNVFRNEEPLRHVSILACVIENDSHGPQHGCTLGIMQA